MGRIRKFLHWFIILNKLLFIMKMNFFKIGMCLFVFSSMMYSADAQRTPRRRNNTQNPDTLNRAPEQINNNNAAPTYNPNVNIPITYDTAGANSNVRKPSLRPDNAFDKSNLTSRTPLPYEHLRWDDALYAEKVWRELDLREKMNQTFRYDAQDDNGSQLFVDLLLKAVQKDSVVAWADDRFTIPLGSYERNQQ